MSLTKHKRSYHNQRLLIPHPDVPRPIHGELLQFSLTAFTEATLTAEVGHQDVDETGYLCSVHSAQVDVESVLLVSVYLNPVSVRPQPLCTETRPNQHTHNYSGGCWERTPGQRIPQSSQRPAAAPLYRNTPKSTHSQLLRWMLRAYSWSAYTSIQSASGRSPSVQKHAQINTLTTTQVDVESVLLVSVYLNPVSVRPQPLCTETCSNQHTHNYSGGMLEFKRSIKLQPQYNPSTEMAKLKSNTISTWFNLIAISGCSSLIPRLQSLAPQPHHSFMPNLNSNFSREVIPANRLSQSSFKKETSVDSTPDGMRTSQYTVNRFTTSSTAKVQVSK